MDQPPERNGSGDGRPPRRRGRPPAMSTEAMLERIRRLARRGGGLFMVDHTHPDLYGRARRRFGSWATAVTAAGLDYDRIVRQAQDRSRKRPRRGSAHRGPKR